MLRIGFIIIIFSLLSACGVDRGMPLSESITSGSLEKGMFHDPLDLAEATYPLMDVVKSGTNQQDVSRVFAVEGQSIELVSSHIQDHVVSQPIEVSEVKDQKQVIVYDQYFVTLTRDPDNTETTLVEIANYGFVRDNYQPNFFNGLLVWWLLDDLLDVDDWKNKQQKRCQNSIGGCYGSYGGTGPGYKGPIGQPSLRGGSSSVRGGGPGTGK
ncbi:hypothetical protein JOC85_001320 [Bacillus mesophilus]|uniref:DUF4247 domain-containing protein n=1 Tax=Bacillus mesophilus TaxID=1808955 RepID=A0A6M0Q6G1_9BACI|nr:DUF4247 domain-containing protein [Bacillus mesophilus]MBM7660548.1 hypothetical protein [Bacillus mesophilus]NEY71904.1 DUF4247 domain-containing protein [Bacillus mesophilus]